MNKQVKTGHVISEFSFFWQVPPFFLVQRLTDLNFLMHLLYFGINSQINICTSQIFYPINNSQPLYI
jgi:hypothetical protein